MTESIYAYIIVVIISLVIIWAFVYVPVWISAKILTSSRARFGRVMLVKDAGPIVYALVLIISTGFLSLAIGNRSSLIVSIGVVLGDKSYVTINLENS